MDCPNCFRPFTNENANSTPRILVSCGHSVCTQCIFSLINNDHEDFDAEEKDNPGGSCPEC